jgi:hypothetical protein
MGSSGEMLNRGVGYARGCLQFSNQREFTICGMAEAHLVVCAEITQRDVLPHVAARSAFKDGVEAFQRITQWAQVVVSIVGGERVAEI